MKWKNIRTKNSATFLTKTIHLFVLWFVYFLKRCIESNFRGKYPISEPCISNSIKLLSFSEIVGRINHKILYLVICCLVVTRVLIHLLMHAVRGNTSTQFKKATKITNVSLVAYHFLKQEV